MSIPQHEDHARDWRDDTITGAFQGASGTGQMETGPDADAISILQRVRDGLLALPASSTEGSEAA